MCRLAGYVGHAPIGLSALLYDAPHSLQHAAYAPEEMLAGRVNVDGTGVAWWQEATREPLRYVTSETPWADPNLPDLARRLMGSTILAAVRSATPGIGFGASNVAPFVAGPLASVHNGWIGGFNGPVGRDLLDRIDDDRFGLLQSLNDSLVLFTLVAQSFDRNAGVTLDEAVANTIRLVSGVVVAANQTAALNLVVATEGQMVATRTSVGSAVNSLYTRTTAGEVWLASEPLDNHRDWRALGEHTLTVLTATGAESRTLDHPGVNS